MKHILLLPIFLIFILKNENLHAQTVEVQGAVSYVSSQNVYVKFVNTEGIATGDTLFLRNGDLLSPALRVSNKSSTSAVCARLVAGAVFKNGDLIFAKIPAPKKEKKETATAKKEENEPPLEHEKNPEAAAKAEDEIGKTSEKNSKRAAETSKTLPKIKNKQRLRARLSAASYSNFYNERERHRMRYAFTLQGNQIKKSRFSTDNYITLRHTIGDTAAFQNLNDALKIYSLSVKYDFRDNAGSLTLGRKINPRMASVGAIDGLQFEKNLAKKLLYGVVLGSRPNFQDYRFDFRLLQGGVFVGYNSTDKNRTAQSTLGFLEQRNGGAVDRRYAYLQHSADLTEKLNLFGSMEVDFYENIHDTVSNRARLTNLFVSARYRFSKKLTATLSYDNRKNIIFYESYKNYIDQLIENETRQGLRTGFTFRATRMVNFGATGSWRFQKTTSANDVKNVNAYLNFNRIPVLKINASLSANFLQTAYLESKMYAVRLNKDFLKGKMNLETYYRNIDYLYSNSGLRNQQHVVGGSFSYLLTSKLSLFLFAEKTFSGGQFDFLMFNTKLMQRF